MIDTLALVHTRWWEHTELGVTLGSPHSTESLTAMVLGIAALLPGFCDAAGDDLSTVQRQVFERVFGSRLRPWLRLTNPGARTVIHGDAHSWNFLFPNQKDGPVYLIDWQLWHVDVGARELAFLMAAHWDRERRQALEVRLLRKYHRQLSAGGVDNYSWDDLWLDYRFGVVRNLTLPLILWNRGVQANLWQHRLRCVLAAYEDLRGDEIV
jgi:thiamine kinase-like enzyme